MPKHAPLERLWVVSTVVALLSGCQQVDQILPFELDEDEARRYLMPGETWFD